MINLKQVDIDAAVALCIANGMKEMAGTDGELHPDELSLIDGFTAEIKNEFPNIDVENTAVDVSVLNSEDKQTLFLQCLTYVALADRLIKDEEVALLQKYIDAFETNITPQDLIRELGATFVAQYKDIIACRDTVVSIGKEFGLSEEKINEILS